LISCSLFEPECLFAFAQHGCSAAIVAANCSGVCGGNGSMPNLNSCSLNSGFAWIRWSSADSFATTSLGVPAGATTPCHACQSNPGTVFAIGGTLGNRLVGFAAEVPSATTLPAWIFGIAMVASQNMTWMLPVRRSVNAAGVPLYGTCWMSSPNSVLSASMNR
jgi:hypothetical protein